MKGWPMILSGISGDRQPLGRTARGRKASRSNESSERLSASGGKATPPEPCEIPSRREDDALMVDQGGIFWLTPCPPVVNLR
jgi:hypothetical protein